MDSYTKSETRVEYSDPTITNRPVPLKAFGPGFKTDYADWPAGELFPFITPSLRTLYEERAPVQSGNTRGTWNNFEHYKMSGEYPNEVNTYSTCKFVSGLPYGHTFNIAANRTCWKDSVFGPADNPTNGLPLLYQKNNVTGSFVKTVSNIDTLINTAVRQMLGQSRPETSLINSLLELKDIKSLPRHTAGALALLQKVRKELPIALQGISAFHGKILRKQLLRVLGVLSGALLQSEFNIRPLYNDILVIQNSLHTVRREILRRIRDDGVRRRRDYNVSLDKDFVDNEELSPIYSVSYASGGNRPPKMEGGARIFRRVVYHRKLFHAQVEYSQYYTEFQKQNALLLDLLDRLGVMFDPSIIWNAIPWSFVIDWVIGVNRWLAQFRVSNLEPVTLIHKFCWSQNVTRTIHCVVQPQGANPPNARGFDRIASSITESAYIRNTQRLNVVAALEGSGISSREFILASALKLSRQR